jgi:hypothetical protein
MVVIRSTKGAVMTIRSTIVIDGSTRSPQSGNRIRLGVSLISATRSLPPLTSATIASRVGSASA